MNVLVPLNERLKEAMNIKGMRAVDLSKKSGFSEAQISRWLSGEYLPRQNKILKLSYILGVNPAWLMGYNIDINQPLNTELAETHNYEPVVEEVTPNEFKNEVLDLLDKAHMDQAGKDMIKRTLEYVCKDEK